jgi:uncharacterized protein YbjT (DUF2867 family)
MKILLTGATGYIGKRLLPKLIEQGHEVICCVRDKKRFSLESYYNHPSISLFEADFLKDITFSEEVKDIDVAYYLIHSMTSNVNDFDSLESLSANNFVSFIEKTNAKQIIYLGGITNDKDLSKHLQSRKNVEDILSKSKVPLTSIKAGIIVGSGSASFEIIRDLVDKLPVMITPKWLNTKSQPISIRNVLQYLIGVLLKPETFNQSFDIGGPDILTYKEMLIQFGEARGVKRYIYTVPVMTPRLSSYWLYFVTSTSYPLAINLVNSMKVEVVAKDNRLEKMLGINPIPYKEAVKFALERIHQDTVPSSWKDSLVSSGVDNSLLNQVHIPSEGCFFDKREKEITTDVNQVLNNIWSIGGDRGWYYGDWLWHLRGIMDKMVGGVGLRRGRTNAKTINAGDTLDFWRVIVADKKKMHLLLYAEMVLPGDAWLEFKIEQRDNKYYLKQTATFKPDGLQGKMYWYSVLPFHFFIFDGMAENLIHFKE